jgi:predicted RNase H-like HicB family nuclease
MFTYGFGLERTATLSGRFHERKVANGGIKMTAPIFNVYLTKGVDGFIIAECPDIPGCMSQGKTIEEAKENIKDAITACLSVIMEDLFAQKKRSMNLPDDILEIYKLKIASMELETI